MRPLVDEFTQKDGRRIYVLGEGRLINLAAAEGHPAAVMDMSFANQPLSVEHLVREGRRLEHKVYRVPIPAQGGPIEQVAGVDDVRRPGPTGPKPGAACRAGCRRPLSGSGGGVGPRWCRS